MNWFKKLFASSEEEYKEEIEVEEKSVSTTRSKTPFRFPLISDYEKNDPIYEQTDEENIINEPFIEKQVGTEQTYKPLYTQEIWQQRKHQPVVHRSERKDVDETPAIIRKRRTFTPTEVPSPVFGYAKIKETSLGTGDQNVGEAYRSIIQETWQQRKQQKQQTETKQSTQSIVETPSTMGRRRGPFVPSEVPSPIYGLSKERKYPINNESIEKGEKLVTTSKEDAPTFAIPEQSVIEETAVSLLEVEEQVLTEKQVLTEESVLVEEQGLTEVSVLVEEQVLNEEQVLSEESVLVEEPVLNEEQVLAEEVVLVEEPVLNEEPVLTEEPVLVEEQVLDEETALVEEQVLSEEGVLNEQQVLSEEPVQNEEPVLIEDKTLVERPIEGKENIRPFNVLMLKSDKEKIMEKERIAEQPIARETQPIDSPDQIVIEEKEKVEGTFALEQASEEKMEEPKENIRPFNVLMLKSDKDKLNKLNVNDIKQPIYQESSETIIVPTKVPEPIVEQEFVPSNYTKPSFSYLLPPEMKDEDKEWMEEQAYTLIEALSHFQVTGEIVQMVQGPAVTQFELTVGHGTKVSKIRNLADDLKLALAAKDIRIQAPIPGKRSIGIEIPNRTSRAVRLSEVINTDVFTNSDSPLEAALGLDLTGKPVTLDLRKMPHGLIAGATGSGKSIFINSLLVSLLYKATPEEVKLLLIDPKMVELAPFNHVPHLISPVITDVKAATAALKWAVEEMERRYQLFAHIGVRDISRYNALATEKRQFAQKLPYIVIVIDELADLMMMAPVEVEDAICRIAQKARACGIHLVLATQRPSVDVITGLIKANIPTRIAFSVSSQIDSRTILDQQGAERLLGKGDMLYQGNGMSSPVRIQGTYVSDDEIEAVIEYARGQGTPEYIFEQDELLQKAETSEQDELFEEACRFIVEQGSASTSLLQRKFHLGYNRAARLIDAMYESGYITEQRGSKARDVLLTNESLDQIFS